MENTYGIGVRNRYELFYDEDVDPLEIIRQQEEEKEKRKTDKAHCKDKTKTSKPGKQISTAIPKKTPKDIAVTNAPKLTEPLDKTSNKPFDRSAKNRASEDSKDVEDRKNFRNRENHQNVGFESRERDSEGRGGRGAFRGRGRSRGRGSFFGNFEGRPARREFDRHSGSDKTGVRPTEKKDAAASDNWIDIKTDGRKDANLTWTEEEFEVSGDKGANSNWIDSFEENIAESPKRNATLQEKNTEDSVPENMDSKENEPVPEERTEESFKEMTLDEWKKEQEAKRVVPKYNLRKPGEGEDGNQWKKLYMLKKKLKEDDDEEEEEDDDDDEEFARRGRQRQLVDIQINFNDSRRGRGRGRGVRGGIGPRSGLAGNREERRERLERRERDDGMSSNIVSRSFGRGNSKSNKSGQQSAPRVDDWNDFPSLVTA